MSNIIDLSATALVAKIKSKELSATEVSTAFIERIHEVNPSLNAVIQFDPERVLEQAKEADQQLLKNEPLGKLHGLPFTIKDTCYVKGFICSKGYPGFYGKAASKDATIIARLKQEGAIPLGLTNVPPLLFGFETDNPMYGRSNNPHDLTKTPGGSSGGEAAIIAAKGSPLGIGSDAGGSLRQPAHCCGIAALKPTQYLIPCTGNVPGDNLGILRPIMSFGPMARSVEDLALVLPILAGEDGHDPATIPMPVQNFQTIDISHLKVAYYLDNGIVPIDADSKQVLTKALQGLKPQVASLSECQPECLKKSFSLLWGTLVMSGDGGQSLERLFERTGFDPATSWMIEEFMREARKVHFDMVEFKRRLLSLDQFRIQMLEAFYDYDVILSPVAATPALPHGQSFMHIESFSYTMTHNLTGWPAVVVPVGMNQTGLPIGIQIAAKPWQDHVALALAHALQTMMPINR